MNEFLSKIEFEDTGILIDYAELKYMKMRFFQRPAELVRRLLVALIGPDELKTMTARGRKSKDGRKPIPKNIFDAIFRKFLRITGLHAFFDCFPKASSFYLEKHLS